MSQDRRGGRGERRVVPHVYETSHERPQNLIRGALKALAVRYSLGVPMARRFYGSGMGPDPFSILAERRCVAVP